MTKSELIRAANGRIVYAVQGGGCAVACDKPNLGLFEFIEAPEWAPAMKLVPEEWAVADTGWGAACGEEPA